MHLTAIYAILLAFVLAVHAGKPSTDYCDISHYSRGNGSQIPAKPTCVSTSLGEVPDIKHMISTLIQFPTQQTTIKANKPFTVVVGVTGLETGNFLNPDTEYYKFSQQLDSTTGNIKGHLHITIQQLNSPKTPPDPTKFAFFLGLNGKASKDVLTANVDKLSPGLYRLCTISASASHAPVVMPVAKRGAQDDCVRFNVK